MGGFWHTMPPVRRLLLISNSTNHGQGYLDHVLGEIDDFLGPIRLLLFVPFALKDREGYGARVRAGWRRSASRSPP
jgi:peptidase E